MPKESLQKKVGRVRPPRVQITYDVEIDVRTLYLLHRVLLNAYNHIEFECFLPGNASLQNGRMGSRYYIKYN